MSCFSSGKLNSSLNRSLSGSTGSAPSRPANLNKPANHIGPRRSSVYATAEPQSSAAGRRSVSVLARRPSEAERAKTTKFTPLKKAEAKPQLTPAKRALERTALTSGAASARPQSGLKAKPKPEAVVQPTPGSGLRGAQPGDGEGGGWSFDH